MTLLSLTRTAPTLARLQVARFEISKACATKYSSHASRLCITFVSSISPHIGYDYFHYSMKSARKKDWDKLAPVL